jgi:hypothetical protein
MLHLRGRSVCVCVCLCLGLVAASTPALAAPKDGDDELRMQAQTLFDEGTKKAESDPRAALAAFRAAFEVQADFHVLYNIAYLYLRVADAPNAIRAYERYLRDGGDKVPLKRRREVELQLKRLRSNVGKVTVGAVAKDLDVRVDGVVVGRTPLSRPLSLVAGNHKLTLAPSGPNAPAAPKLERAVKVIAGDTVTVDFEEPKPPPPSVIAVPPAPPTAESDVTAAQAPPTAPAPAQDDGQQADPPPEPPRPAPASKRGAPVVPWVITGALAAGTGAAAYFTESASVQYGRLRNSFPITRQDLDGAQAKTQNLMTTTMVLGGATLFSAAIAAYLSFTARAATPRDERRPVALGPGPGLAGVSVEGSLP